MGGHIFKTITARDYKGICNQGINGVVEINSEEEIIGLVDDQGRKKKELVLKRCCPTLRSEAHGNQPKILIKEATTKGYAEATDGDSVNFGQPNSSTRRGRVGKGVANALTCASEMGVVASTRIRRLTPKECFRLQGWSDEYFDRAALVNSDTQLYKQAGNGVTVSVIKAIGEKME